MMRLLPIRVSVYLIAFVLTFPVYAMRKPGEEIKPGINLFSYPSNWEVFGGENSPTVTIAPREGIVQDASGGGAIGYGAVVSFNFHELHSQDLQKDTDEMIQHLRAGNPSMRVSVNGRRVTVDGSPGMVTTLASNSPYQGQTEADVLLTIVRPQGLFYMVFIAPERDFRNLQGTFDEMVRSLRFTN